jgi:hypothetical protein
MTSKNRIIEALVKNWVAECVASEVNDFTRYAT